MIRRSPSQLVKSREITLPKDEVKNLKPLIASRYTSSLITVHISRNYPTQAIGDEEFQHSLSIAQTLRNPSIMRAICGLITIHV